MQDDRTLGGIALVVIFGILFLTSVVVNKCNDFRQERASPIPPRFQGAYNSYACGIGDVSGLVTVGDDSINFNGAVFEVSEKASEDDNSVVLKGRPLTGGGREDGRTFTITYAAVGGTARLDGAEFTRCSQY